MSKTLVLTDENHGQVADEIRQFVGVRKFTISITLERVEKFPKPSEHYNLGSVGALTIQDNRAICLWIAGMSFIIHGTKTPVFIFDDQRSLAIMYYSPLQHQVIVKFQFVD